MFMSNSHFHVMMLTGLEVRSLHCNHFFTSFALGNVISREIGFIKPTLAQKLRTTLDYLDSQVAIGHLRVPKVSSLIPQGVSAKKISLEVVSMLEHYRMLIVLCVDMQHATRSNRLLCSTFSGIHT